MGLNPGAAFVIVLVNLVIGTPPRRPSLFPPLLGALP